MGAGKQQPWREPNLNRCLFQTAPDCSLDRSGSRQRSAVAPQVKMPGVSCGEFGHCATLHGCPVGKAMGTWDRRKRASTSTLPFPTPQRAVFLYTVFPYICATGAERMQPLANRCQAAAVQPRCLIDLVTFDSQLSARSRKLTEPIGTLIRQHG